METFPSSGLRFHITRILQGKGVYRLSSELPPLFIQVYCFMGASDPLPVIPLGGVSAVILWFILDVEEGLIEGTKHDAVVVGDMVRYGHQWF
jgi:hypothetical protein